MAEQSEIRPARTWEPFCVRHGRCLEALGLHVCVQS